jgi:medium-chain acyl-[acyl-carrier-protein] hydrolase
MSVLLNPDVWVIRPRPNPRAGMRLFCFPYAGGNAAIYRGWAAMLPDEVELCAVQLPGRGARLREEPFRQLEPLVAALLPALQPFLDRPFALFGHSMGSLIAFELSRALRQLRRPGPLHLFVSGRFAPQIPDPDPPCYALPTPEFVQELRRLQGTPEEVLDSPELLELVLPLLRADFELSETYRYRPGVPLACPISAFGGAEDLEVTAEGLGAWREQTRSLFRARTLPGDHFFLIPRQTELLAAIGEDLAHPLRHLHMLRSGS